MRRFGAALATLLILCCGRQVYKRVILDLDGVVVDEHGRPQPGAVLTLEDIGLSDYRRTSIAVGTANSDGTLRRRVQYRYDQRHSLVDGRPKSTWAVPGNTLRLRIRLPSSKEVVATLPPLTLEEALGRRAIHFEMVPTDKTGDIQVRFRRPRE